LDAELIGVSQNICTIKQLISRVADTELNALVYGETGVGKELVVHNLYQKSNRFGKPFVKVNCAALPDTLLESEMFGYERGAFTGAQHKMRGKFEQTNGGVLFLDEIGDMSLGLQSKLLHALQDGTFTPLGSEKSLKTDTWVIAATNHDLKQDLLEGKFRQDLYYRLTTITIHIEPLRKRPEDIPYLIKYYTKKYALRYNGNQPKTLSQGVLDTLSTYHWPGNVRELQNILKRIMIFGVDEGNIDKMLSEVSVSNSTVNNQSPSQNPPLLINWSSFNSEQMPDLPSLSLKKIKKKVKAEVDRELIQYVLEKTGWNRTKASHILKISYRALISRIKDLNIQPPSILK
jgi:transcriptional regulator with GAF, ATPase, and Fis domain